MITFGLNDWFLILSSGLALFVFIRLPKRFAGQITILIWLFNIWLVQSVDYVLGVEPLNLYDFMDVPKWEPTYALAHFTLYPIFGYLFLYFLQSIPKKKWIWTGYLFAAVALSTLYEYVCLKVGVIHYVRWSLLYSLFFYIGIFVLEIWAYRFFRHLQAKS